MPQKSSYSGTTEVREEHRFDEKALLRYLAANVEGFSGSLSVRQFKHGQSNPTFLLIDADKKFILRKQPPGKLLPSAHAVDREYRILSALQDTDVPVPKTVLFCGDASIVGTPFYLMEMMEGRVFRDAIASEVGSAEQRGAVFDDMIDTLARIHLVDWKAQGLADFGKPGNYMARQVHRWTRQYESSRTREIDSMNRLMAWLPQHIPSDDTTAITHGDYRIDNLIVHPEEPRVVAVLDWELSTLGHPLADLAYNCMRYHLPSENSLDFGFKDHDLRALGIPSESETIDAYCRRIGRESIADWNFYLAFGMFRLAAIVQGVYKRGLDGIASSCDAMLYGAMVELLSDTAWEIVNRS